MFAKKTLEHNTLADQAALKAENAIKSTQRVTNDALEGLANSVEDARQQISPVLNRASEQANLLAQRSIDAVRDTSQQLRDRAMQATAVTSGYIRNDPVKAVLIAAATGAALMALISLMTRSRD